VLKPGDLVEIHSSSEKVPGRDWLNYAFTSTARHHIKRWLNLQDRIKNTELGKKMWHKQISKYSLPPEVKKGMAMLSHISRGTHFHIKRLDDFYEKVGSGKIILNKKLMEKIFPELDIAKKKDTILKKIVTKVAKKPSPVVQVTGKDSPHLKLAKCCFPIKGESIIGYITSGKGLTVHSMRCPLVAKEILDPHRIVEASWDKTSKGTYQGRLLINAQDIPGVLAKLTSVIAQQKGNITKAEVITFPDKKAEIKLILHIDDIEHLDKIMSQISKIKEIVSVDRV
jgi:GTP pyrophosphokinase